MGRRHPGAVHRPMAGRWGSREPASPQAASLRRPRPVRSLSQDRQVCAAAGGSDHALRRALPSSCRVSVFGRLEPRAAADRRDPEIEGRVLRVPTGVYKILRCLLTLVNKVQFRHGRVLFAEVDAQTAFSVVNGFHDWFPSFEQAMMGSTNPSHP